VQWSEYDSALISEVWAKGLGMPGRASDFDGDGLEDFSVGSAEWDVVQTGDGGMFVYYAPLPSGVFRVADADATLHGEYVQGEDGPPAYVGDLDGDGYDEVATHNQTWPTRTAATWFGRLSVVYGPPPTGRTSLADADLTFTGIDPTDMFANPEPVTADLNADGSRDVVVSAYWHRDPTVFGGAAFVWYGGWPASGAYLTSDADATLLSTTENAALGCALGSPGDVTADGIDDLVVATRGGGFTASGSVSPYSGTFLVYFGGTEP
jgi:hypothetical protein